MDGCRRPPSKSYAAVPPPQQLLAGGALDATTDSSSRLRSGSDATPGGQEVQESPTTSTSFENNCSMATSAAHVPVVASTGVALSLFTFYSVCSLMVRFARLRYSMVLFECEVWYMPEISLRRLLLLSAECLSKTYC